MLGKIGGAVIYLIRAINFGPVTPFPGPHQSHFFPNDSIFPLFYTPRLLSLFEFHSIPHNGTGKGMKPIAYALQLPSQFPISIPNSVSHRHPLSTLSDSSIAQVCLAYSGGLDTSCICTNIISQSIHQFRILIPNCSEVPHRPGL